LKYRKNYEDILSKLPPDLQEEMKERIRVTDDGKIEVIPINKKFSILVAEHNGKDIFKGEYKDEHGKTGMKGMIYLTGRAAERECKKQNKKLFDDNTEVDQFIGFFP
jgi:hypothetical protein